MFGSIGVEVRGSKRKREDYLEKDYLERHNSSGVEQLDVTLTENVELILKCDSLLGAMR